MTKFLADRKHSIYAAENSIHHVFPEAAVLIVDDLLINLRVAQGLMADYEMRIDCVESGQEALNKVRKQYYDLIFMDHMMPGMDGVEATAAIRAMEGEYFKKVPVIALTANAIAGMREMFLSNGFSDFLFKPIEIAKLDEILEKWIPMEKRRNVSQTEKTGETQSVAICLPEIEGVDMRFGLERVGGSREVYRNLLEVFQRDVRQRLTMIEKVEDLQAFTINVHALKSALVNIGAKDLSEASALLEAAGHRGEYSFIEARLNDFRAALIALNARVEKALVIAQFHDSAHQDKNASRILEALDGLKAALKTEDIDGMDVALQALRSLPLAQEQREGVTKIAELMLVSEFEEALRLLETM